MSSSILETVNLTKRYGEHTAVNSLNLKLNKGEILGLLGPNGAGKTTIINMICGVTKPSSGEVLYKGDGYERSLVSTLIGVCPQETILYEQLTCLEQLEFIGEMYDVPLSLARERSLWLLELMGLLEKRNSLVKTLSGGMKRRLNLILALIHDPEIVILDEPEAGLDPQSRVLVREFITKLSEEKTVILTTHNMHEAELLSDRVAIIDHGNLIAVDTPHNLKRLVGLDDVIEIELDPEAAVDRTGYEIVGNTLFIHTMDTSSDLFQALNDLKTNGVEAKEVRFRKTSLEDVFIKYTGRRLRE